MLYLNWSLNTYNIAIEIKKACGKQMQPAGSFFIQLSEQVEKPDHNLHSGNKAGDSTDYLTDVIHDPVSSTIMVHIITQSFITAYARRYQRA